MLVIFTFWLAAGAPFDPQEIADATSIEEGDRDLTFGGLPNWFPPARSSREIPSYLELEIPDPRGADPAVRATFVARQLGGHLKVRENAVDGTTLRLGRDLGYGDQVGGRVGFTYAESGLEAAADVEYLDGSARRTATRPFNYNGASYAAGESIRTLTHFLTVRLHLAFREILGKASWGWTGPVVGIEYPYYTTNVTAPTNPHSLEDWVHYYPYPVIGWAGRVNLGWGLSVGGRATVGYLPNLPSAYIEGGRLYVSVRPSIFVDLPLVWEASPNVRLSLGFTYQDWHGGDHSVEDGNVLHFSAPGLTASFEYAW
jgi:hypothetical protein